MSARSNGTFQFSPLKVLTRRPAYRCYAFCRFRHLATDRAFRRAPLALIVLEAGGRMGLSLPSVVVRTALGFTVSLSWVWPNTYGGGRVTFLTPHDLLTPF
jgi:hypothetical protein